MLHILAFLLFGLIVGALARWIVPGRDSGGWITSMAVGVGGAMLGGLIGRVVGLYRDNQPGGFIMSLFGAIILVVLHHAATSRHRHV